jgi:hypothetical protein
MDNTRILKDILENSVASGRFKSILDSGENFDYFANGLLSKNGSFFKKSLGSTPQDVLNSYKSNLARDRINGLIYTNTGAEADAEGMGSSRSNIAYIATNPSAVSSFERVKNFKPFDYDDVASKVAPHKYAGAPTSPVTPKQLEEFAKREGARFKNFDTGEYSMTLPEAIKDHHEVFGGGAKSFYEALHEYYMQGDNWLKNPPGYAKGGLAQACACGLR